MTRRCSTPRQPLDDEVDEEREIVDARVPLGEQVAFDPLEPADQLVHEAADLGEVAADRHHLRAEAVLHRVADAGRQRRLELGGRRRERLDLVARPLERRVERGRLDPSGSGLVDAGLRPLDRVGIHRGRRYSRDRTAAPRRHDPVSDTGCAEPHG